MTRDRLYELLADEATEGLSTVDQMELMGLLSMQPGIDRQVIERSAAAVDLALMPSEMQPLPRALRQRVLDDAGRFFEPRDQDEAEPQVISLGSRRGWGWYAAAACFLFAIVGWWQAMPSSRVAFDREAFESFVDQSADAIRVAWKGQEPGYENVSGEAVWSDGRQEGCMRFFSLPPNDPRIAQYQLWIVDPDRDKHPVDGGVFDVAATGEAFIRMKAKLQVREPKAFAITLEQPGGVVVSDGPLLVVASAES